MKRLGLLLLAGALCVVGCQSEQFRSQPLGRVSYAEAFRAGKDALARHFTIASADSATGRIVARPKPIQAPADRLLGSSPARQFATMEIRRKQDDLYADIRVNIQRQDLGAARIMQPVTVDNELPNRTPAQESAAVTSAQNQYWETTGRDYQLERTILAELLRRLSKPAP